MRNYFKVFGYFPPNRLLKSNDACIQQAYRDYERIYNYKNLKPKRNLVTVLRSKLEIILSRDYQIEVIWILPYPYNRTHSYV
ncbi:hypothetical protein [Oceanobacillus sp. CAU 1775]